jgi:thiol-disulfide isomerase/thioredoxin
MLNKLVLLILVTALTAQFTSAQNKLQTGVWRGALKTSSGNDIAFNFDVTDTAGAQQITIINGDERFKVKNVTLSGDSVFIQMPLFDSEFRLKSDQGSLTGNWIRHLGTRNTSMPFVATPNTTWRILKDTEKPAFNISGRWSAIFGEGTSADTTVGEFKQTGAKITGTFLTTTGDYRYLEGIVAGNKMYLSCFDGGHDFLFTATIKDNQTLTDGKFYAGYTSATPWTAIKDEHAKLPDAYALTALKPGYKKLDFSYPDLNGQKISLNDPRFKNKVVIVEIMGSWCPNCMDETAYLVNYYKKYHAKGVEIVGLAYERTSDFTISQQSLLKEKAHFNVPYPLLITGYTSNKTETAKSLPGLTNFLGFPTTIIIDKNGDVRKIYTGFSGPGTGVYYTDFVKGFEKITDKLLLE